MRELLRRYPGLAGLPRADLGVRPTPTEEHVIGGLTVLVKRDDRSSPLFGGNKMRSLEYLLAAPAKHQLTFSSLSAYHAYAAGVAGRALSVPTTAVIVGIGRPTEHLAALTGVCEEVVRVGGVPEALLSAAARWRRGVRLVPPGGMSPRGALGYLEAALEIDPLPTRVYAPLGTGTTVSGLLAGFMLRGADVEVVGVRVADYAAGVRPLLFSRAFRAIALLRRHDPSVPAVCRGRVRLRVVPAEGAYGEPTEASVRAVEAARPLRLETTYTGKALAVLLAERAEGALFVNTYAGPLRAGRPSRPGSS
jgi:1-aminocyclopropane-1-carboxylate deaminase/D-cysteine desulfhydrase-like pyridoxal-dependent ACC family enzyme